LGTDGILLLTGQGASKNQIQGNSFARKSQTCLVGGPGFQCGEAIVISDASDNVVGGTLPGARNIVSAPSGFGCILIESQTATGNLVQGNFIGLDVTGASSAKSSEGVGVSALNVTIGGTTPRARNVISTGGRGVGVVSNGQKDTGTLIQGNFIGTDVTGTKPLGNSDGVTIFFAKGTTVGGEIPAARNIISGNGQGVVIGSGGAGISCFGACCGSEPGGADFEVVGNYIGTDVSGTQPLGNRFSGVVATDNAFSHEIRGNRIAFNGGNGVAVLDGMPARPPFFPATLPAFSIRILENSIFSNGLLAIDLGNDGVTPNDLRDPDAGPNLKQNFPELSSAVFVADATISAVMPGAVGTVNIQGNFNSLPRQTFTIEFFSDSSDGSSLQSSAAGNSCPPQARNFLGSTTVTTNRQGNATIGVVLPVSDPTGFVNATATSLDGNTSEISACVQAGIPVGPTISTITIHSELIAEGFGFKKPVQVLIDGMPFSEPSKVKKGTKVIQRGRVVQPDGTTRSIERTVPPGKTVKIRFRNQGGGETEVSFRN
jgi:hypothetical protein